MMPPLMLLSFMPSMPLFDMIEARRGALLHTKWYYAFARHTFAARVAIITTLPPARYAC